MSHTTGGALLGTPWYMAPEQLRGEDPDPSWDLWALAVMAFEMLSGSHPFASMTLAHDLPDALSRQRPPFGESCRRRAGTSLPARWRSIVRRGRSRRRPFSASSSGACMPDGSFPAPRAGRFATTRWSLVLAAGQTAGCAFGGRADRTVRDVLVSGLRVHPPAGLSSRRMRRPDAGILRARAREELLSRRRSGARTLSRVSLRLDSALSVERTRSRADPEARRRLAADLARRRNRRRDLPTRAARRSDARKAVRSPLGAHPARTRPGAPARPSRCRRGRASCSTI